MSKTAAVFRADTTSDVITASIVAGQTEFDRAILLLSSDWTSGQSEGYMGALRLAAGLHPWEAVVALPSLPVNQANGPGAPRLSRAAAIRATKATASSLAGLLASSGLDPRSGNEVFLTCLHHDDVRMLAAAFPWSAVNAYPHSFISLTRPELDQYAPFVGQARSLQSPRDAVVDGIKRMAFGHLAVPVRQVQVRRAFTFDHPAPWAHETVDLRGCLTRETLEGLFDRLPRDVRVSAQAIGNGARSPALLLLAHDDLFRDNRSLELESYRRLVEHMVDKHGVDRTLVKSHPRSHPSHARDVTTALARELRGLSLVTMDADIELPVELLTARLELAAAAGIGSTALKVLAIVRDIPTYSATDAWLTLLQSDAGERLKAESWLEDCGGFVTPIP